MSDNHPGAADEPTDPRELSDPAGLPDLPEPSHALAEEAPQEALDAADGPGAPGVTGTAEGAQDGSQGPAEALSGAAASDGTDGRDGTDGTAEPDGTDEDDVDDDGLGAPTLPSALEALLLVTDEPIDIPTLASVVRRPTGEVEQALRALAADYDEQGRGFELREVAGGWRYYTRADCSAVVERYVRDGQTARLTQAALETLAVIAYRQPVSRARVSAVRGVNVDGVIRTLHTRGLIAEAGHDPTSQAILYRTTELFLERLGISSLEELPPLADYLPDIELLDALADEM